MSDTSVNQLGRTLGDRYELVSVIGSGASARVYHAKDLRLGRSVAIKQLRAGYAADPRFLKLFRSEATLAAQLTHPNIMTVYDWSDDSDGGDGGPYLVTQLLSGGTLRGVLNHAGTFDDDGELEAAGTLSPSQVAFIGLQAAQGLAFAHEQGLVHRDIKPANLLFGQDGRIHIGDFGIARAVAEAAWTEPEGVLIGTARYAAPEQATDALIDGAADVYSLTVCLVEALTGQIPLVRENALGTMVQRQKTDIPVDEDWGPLAQVLAASGTAEVDERSTSSQMLEGLLSACQELPDPEPLDLLDLTFVPDRPTTGSVTVITADGVAVEGGADAEPSADQAENETGFVGSSGTPMSPVDNEGEDSAESVPGAATGPESDAKFAKTAPAAEPRRRRWPRTLALLLLIVGAGGAALYGGMMLAQSQEETAIIEVSFPTFAVGDYSSMTADEVQAEVEPLGWKVETSEVRRDGTVAGELLSQSPPPETLFEPGSGPVIELVYSAGSELRIVPTMVGESRDDALSAIEAAKLEVGEEIRINDEEVPAEVVMSATIDGAEAKPGDEWVTGTVVDLTVSAGPAKRTVPDISSMSLDEAKKAIDDLGLTFAIEEKASRRVPEGDIISQSPSAGAKLDRGKAVTITVSTGLPFVTIPAVRGLTVPAATTKLENLGFEVAGVDGSPARAVTGTNPAEGKALRYGSSLRLTTR